MPEKFKGEHREVNLKGEAYFEVTKNRKHSFIVQTESVNVEVLGTHFNVESYPDDPGSEDHATRRFCSREQ